MNSEFAIRGQRARDVLRLLENREVANAQVALQFLRALPYVDAHEVAAIGHSSAGSLTLLLAERDPKRPLRFADAAPALQRAPENTERISSFCSASRRYSEIFAVFPTRE